MPANDSLSLRALDAADFDAFGALVTRAFSEEADADVHEHERALFEPERSLGTFDGDEIVGATQILTMSLTVPGGADLPVAGVTGVGVAATHRRRGVLRGMMTRQLADVHERGDEAMAILWASEGGIYGRYGYGSAAPRMSFSVPRTASTLINRPDPAVALRYANADADLLGPLYEASRRSRPGGTSRSEAKWAMLLADLPAWRKGTSRLHVVTAAVDGELEGYLTYRTSREWTGSGSQGEVRVQELHAMAPRAAHALWSYAFDLDLMTSTSCWNVPMDAPLLHQLVTPRALGMSWRDGLWVRIVDLPRAVAARGYVADCDVVLEVADEVCPWNAGRWRLAVSGGTGELIRSDRDADLSLSTTDLGTAYLGGPTLLSRAAAGLVQEHRRGALRAASRALADDRAPWPTDMF